jgi:hypothetical protein
VRALLDVGDPAEAVDHLILGALDGVIEQREASQPTRLDRAE